MNNITGVTTPVTASAPVTTPVTAPVTTPVTAPVTTPVTTQVPASGAAPVITQVPASGAAPSVTAQVTPPSVTTTATPEAPPSVTPPSVTTTATPEATTWFAKIKPFLTIENSIISFIIMGIGIALYFFSSIIIKKIFKEGFGEDTKEENSKKVKIDEVERQLQDRITSINTNLTSLKKRMDDADIVKDNKPTNLAIAIQNNILAVKEAMMKIIAGLVIQTKMNNGALNVVSQTNAFQKNMTDSINNLTNPK
jgi:hypothetical protein